MRICECGCGRSIEHKSRHAKFYNNSCRVNFYRQQHGNGTLLRPFVSLDGEGISSNYVLLACGNGEFIQRRNGLTTDECLQFLVTRPRGNNSGIKPIYVWFAFDYDVNMILGDLPLRGENSIEELRKYNKVSWHGFQITYIPRKILRVRYGDRVHTSYDVWGFFASTFEKACENWNLKTTPLLAEGKSSRGNFSRWSLKKIREYNDEELQLLQQLCEKLRDSINPLELPIQSWHGPAALAAAWLRKHNCRNYLADPPEKMQIPVACAYFGGRIDVAGFGYCNPVYHYDIVSAYPAAIRYLPDLTKLNWVNAGKDPPSREIYLARIRWEIPARLWGVFPWRARDGSILWPMQGESWLWSYEIEAAKSLFDSHCFEVVDSWVPQGILQYPFLDLITETFAYRAELKRKNNPSHVPVKLILNSLYGKFAQTVGKASYHSLIWAGLITSYTRAELMRQITDDTVLVMTDSIWSRKPLQVLLSNSLGGWEQQSEDHLWLAEAGLYAAGKDEKITDTWQRGYDKSNPVDIQLLVSNWLGNDPLFEPVYNVHRFVGMGLALQTSYPWRNWLNLERRIQPVPLVGTTKRLPIFPLGSSDNYGTSNFSTLYPRPRPEKETLSYPYSKSTLDIDRSRWRERLEDECQE